MQCDEACLICVHPSHVASVGPWLTNSDSAWRGRWAVTGTHDTRGVGYGQTGCLQPSFIERPDTIRHSCWLVECGPFVSQRLCLCVAAIRTSSAVLQVCVRRLCAMCNTTNV